MAENAETVEEVAGPPRARLGLTQILAIVGLVIVTQIVMKVVLDKFFPPAYVDPAAEVEVEEVVEEEPEIAYGEPGSSSHYQGQRGTTRART